MADEVLVKDVLTQEMIADGEELTRRLVEAGWSVVAAFWYYSVESSRWTLRFGISEVPARGSHEIYSAIQTELAARPLRAVAFSEIMLLQPEHPLVVFLRDYADKVGGTSPKRVRQGIIGSAWIEDALIYFVPQRRRDAA